MLICFVVLSYRCRIVIELFRCHVPFIHTVFAISSLFRFILMTLFCLCVRRAFFLQLPWCPWRHMHWTHTRMYPFHRCYKQWCAQFILMMCREDHISVNFCSLIKTLKKKPSNERNKPIWMLLFWVFSLLCIAFAAISFFLSFFPLSRNLMSNERMWVACSRLHTINLFRWSKIKTKQHMIICGQMEGNQNAERIQRGESNETKLKRWTIIVKIRGIKIREREKERCWGNEIKPELNRKICRTVEMIWCVQACFFCLHLMTDEEEESASTWVKETINMHAYIFSGALWNIWAQVWPEIIIIGNLCLWPWLFCLFPLPSHLEQWKFVYKM